MYQYRGRPAWRKGLILFIIVFLVIGCVTNPVTEETFSKYQRPMAAEWSWLTGFIPGLTQLLHGEYLEAAIYSVVSYVPLTISLTAFAENEWEMIPRRGYEVPFYIMLGLFYCGSYWGYGEGVYSAYTRNKQWEQIAKTKEVAAPPQIKMVDVNRLRIGMTKAEVLEIFPRPNNVNVSEGSWGRHEQWVYRRSKKIGDEVYLYFENGQLTSWQY